MKTEAPPANPGAIRRNRRAIVLFIALLLGIAFVVFVPGARMVDIRDRLTPGAGAPKVAEGISFGTNGQRLDIWGNADPAVAKPVLIFFYGGGWVNGDRTSYGWAARAYASRGFIVVVPDYRKVPQVHFPAFIEDGAEAVKWTRDNIAKFGGDPNRIVMVGHSAGAHLTAMLTLDRRWLARVGASDTIKAAVGLSGPYDFHLTTSVRARAAMGQWPRPEETQPINFVRADAPPMLLITGDDNTVPPRNAERLTARLKAVGAVAEEKVYPGLGHEDVALALSLPYRGKAPVLDDSVAFLNAQLAKRVPPAQ